MKKEVGEVVEVIVEVRTGLRKGVGEAVEVIVEEMVWGCNLET